MDDLVLVIAGNWSCGEDSKWNFVVSKKQMARLVTVPDDIVFDDLVAMIKKSFRLGPVEFGVSLSFWCPGEATVFTQSKMPPIAVESDTDFQHFKKKRIQHPGLNIFASIGKKLVDVDFEKEVKLLVSLGEADSEDDFSGADSQILDDDALISLVEEVEAAYKKQALSLKDLSANDLSPMVFNVKTPRIGQLPLAEEVEAAFQKKGLSTKDVSTNDLSSVDFNVNTPRLRQLALAEEVEAAFQKKGLAAMDISRNDLSPVDINVKTPMGGNSSGVGEVQATYKNPGLSAINISRNDLSSMDINVETPRGGNLLGPVAQMERRQARRPRDLDVGNLDVTDFADRFSEGGTPGLIRRTNSLPPLSVSSPVYKLEHFAPRVCEVGCGDIVIPGEPDVSRPVEPKTPQDSLGTPPIIRLGKKQNWEVGECSERRHIDKPLYDLVVAPAFSLGIDEDDNPVKKHSSTEDNIIQDAEAEDFENDSVPLLRRKNSCRRYPGEPSLLNSSVLTSPLACQPATQDENNRGGRKIVLSCLRARLLSLPFVCFLRLPCLLGSPSSSTALG